MQATAAELDALLHRAAVAPFSAPGYEAFRRAFLRITGPDANRWLNGMVTNSIQALQPGEGSYNFLLNAQGRILGECTIYREPREGEPTFLLETDSSQLDTIQQTLDRFIIMDEVELQPVLEPEPTLLLLGPDAPRVLAELGFEVPEPLRLAQLSSTGGQIGTPAFTSIPRFELHAAAAILQKLQASALAAGAIQVSGDSLEAFRIFSGTPRYGTDIRNSDIARDLPQETNQTHALHFSKGCYLGQEIVERIRSRGQVHKLFTRFGLQGELPSSLPVRLEADGKPAGELTSAAVVPLPEGPQLFALGYARRELLELPLSYPGGAATPLRASQNLTPRT